MNFSKNKVRVLNFIRKFFMIEPIEKIIISGIEKRGVWSHLFLKLAPNYYQYENKSYRLINKHGIKLYVDISDYIGHYAYFGFEDKTLECILQHVKQDDLVIDVGSNIGYTALNISQKNKNGKIYAFEPDPKNFEVLQSNLNLNHNHNIISLQCGLGDRNESLKLQIINKQNLGGNKINQNATENFHWVKIMRLDSFITENKIESVNIIKIDVEGFELHVLHGSEKTIEKHKPICIIEIDDKNLELQGHKPVEIILFLQRYYNNIINIDSSETITENTSFKDCHFDLIAYC